MRSRLVIDDKLMADALRVTGLRTHREVVELGLRTLISLREQRQDLLELVGKVDYDTRYDYKHDRR